MKTLKLTAMLCVCFVLQTSCEQNQMEDVSEVNKTIEENFPLEYSPLNFVPDWVQTKVTPDEYELWKVLSTRYEIDYSFLRKDVSIERKNEIYDCVDKLCEKIKSDKIDKHEGCLSIFDEENDDPSMLTHKRMKTRREGEEYKTNGCTVYTHNLGPYIKAAITYKYNKSPKTVTISSSSIYTGSPYSAHEPSFSGASDISYDENQELIRASCSGTLSFMNGDRKIEENIQKVVSMIP